MSANQWHKTGNARQEATWEKDNSEKTWRGGANENRPGEIHIIWQDDILQNDIRQDDILQDDILSQCMCQEEACPEILHANLKYHPYKMQVVHQPRYTDNITVLMHHLDLAMCN